MIPELTHKILLLNKRVDVLIIGKIEYNILNAINIYFPQAQVLSITEDSLELINDTYLKNFNIVIFRPENFKTKNIASKNMLLVLDESNACNYIDYTNKIHSSLVCPIDEIDILNKIYSLLAIKESDYSLKQKEQGINKYEIESSKDVYNIGNLLDKFSGSIMFINDDLIEYLKHLKDLDISDDLLLKIATSISEISLFLSQEKSLNVISKVLANFSSLLQELELEEVPTSNYAAFDLLTDIVEDITVFIDDLFIYRILKDVYVVEESMDNNIKYFYKEINKISSKRDEDEDNLEFF